MERSPLREIAQAEVALVRHTRGTPERIRQDTLYARVGTWGAALQAAGVSVSGKAVRGWGLRLDEYATTALGRAGNLMTQVGPSRTYGPKKEKRREDSHEHQDRG